MIVNHALQVVHLKISRLPFFFLSHENGINPPKKLDILYFDKIIISIFIIIEDHVKYQTLKYILFC